MKTAKTEVAANSDVTSGPKYCEGDHTTADPSGETDSMRVMSYNLYGWNALVQVNSTLVTLSVCMSLTLCPSTVNVNIFNVHKSTCGPQI